MLNDPNTMEKETLQNVLLEHLKEQRRARRWNVFFKLSIIAILIFIFWQFNKETSQPVITTQAHTAMIDITGEIGLGHEANADHVRDALKTAFENKLAKGLVLRINSPGGSPVQARLIYDEIRYLKTKHPNMKVYAAIEDVGASAAYLIATAADYIYADKTSIVGSIGAKIDSFGFVEAMKKVGVERRLYHAGKYKGILDPFSPSNPDEEAFINGQLAQVQQVFIDNVRTGRGNRLRETADVFSGLFWTGEDALKLGLIDGFGDAYYIARELVKAEHLIDYSPSMNLLDKLTHRVGASLSTFISEQMGIITRGVR